MSEKVALVTGAARRLGRAIALGLADSGYHIVVNYQHSREDASETVDQIKNHGQDAIMIQADISAGSDVNRMFEQTIAHFGRLDVLVNNAAVFQQAPLQDITEDMWDQTLDINLKGAFLCAQAAAKIMLSRKCGRIINIASAGGLIPYQNHLPYSVSKAGLIMLTKCLAKACAPNVTVNGVAPGSIEFPGSQPELHTPLDRIPLGRLGAADEVVAVVRFLADAADYITGQVIYIDGGRTIV